MGLLSTGVGMDISDHHVRVAWVGHQGAPKGLYELVLPSDYVVDDAVKKPDALRKQLLQLMGESALAAIKSQSVLLVPESRVFSTSFELPSGLAVEAEKAQALRMAQSEIPIPFRDAIIFVREGIKIKRSKIIRMSVLAVQKEIVSMYKQAFQMPQLPFVGVESGGKALFRLYERFTADEFQLQNEKDAIMIVDIGHRWTSISVYDKIGAAIFSRSFTLRDSSEKNRGKVHKMTEDQMLKIGRNLSEGLTFFKESGFRIPLVLLAGVEGAEEKLLEKCRAVIGKQKILRMGEVVSVPDVSPEDVHAYGAAIGAAIRAARPGHYKKDHNFFSV